MSLRTRSILIVAVTFLTLGAALYVFFSTLVMREFERIENRNILNDVERVERAVQNSVQQLGIKTEDWAKWDATYQFLDDRNKDYHDGNLTFETLSAINVSHVAYFDDQGELFLGYSVDYGGSEIRELDRAVLAALSAPGLSKHATSESSSVGLIRIAEQAYLVASLPILDSLRSKPVKGAFVFAKLVDPQYVAALSEQTKLNLQLDQVSSQVPPGAPPTVTPVDENLIQGSAILRDIFDRSILEITVRSPRPVRQQGISTRNSMLVALLAAGLLCTVVVLMLLNRWLLRPLAEMGRAVTRITHSADTSARLREQGRDELSKLASDINVMLSRLDDARGALERARDNAEDSSAAKSSFIATVSHELRTPLHGILGMLRILFKREKSKVTREYLEHAFVNARGLVDTINDILDFSKAEAGKLSIESRRFEIRRTIRESIQSVGQRIEERPTVSLVCSVSPDVPQWIIGDSIRLKQVLVNLLGNAAKFTTAGYIKLRVGTSEGNLVLQVQDSGIGIEASKLETIFEAFSQADGSITRRFKGTGLGLTITRQLVEAMDGQISCSSELGTGSTFTIALPLHVDAARSFVPMISTDSSEFLVLTSCRLFGESVENDLRWRGISVALVDDVPQSLGPQQYLVIDSGALSKPSNLTTLETLALGSDCVSRIILVTEASEITIRERAYSLGILKAVVAPVLPEDVVSVALGAQDPRELLSAGDELEADCATSGVHGLRVAIADDSETNRIILESMLREAGHSVVTMCDGKELLQFLESNRDSIDLVMTDIQMPELDGITLTRIVRSREVVGGRHLPIFAITAHALSSEIEEMIVAGVTKVIAKPIEPRNLAAAILEVFEPAKSLPQQSVTTEQSDRIDKFLMIAHQVVDTNIVVTPSAVDPEFACFKVLTTDLDLNNDALPYGEGVKVVQHSQVASRFLNVDGLLERSGDSVDRALLILRVFQQGHPEILRRLHESVDAANQKQICAAAHALRGLLLDAGSSALADEARFIEERSKAGDFNACRQAFKEIEDNTAELNVVVSAISARMA